VPARRAVQPSAPFWVDSPPQKGLSAQGEPIPECGPRLIKKARAQWGGFDASRDR